MKKIYKYILLRTVQLKNEYMPSFINTIKEKFFGETLENKQERMKLFKKKVKENLFNHFKNTQYFEHKALMKEIIYLLHYTFLVLEDDYFKGDKLFLKGIPNLDDYIFSRYKNEEVLRENIKKLNVIAFSNRFEETPKDNFLSYFVFIEEMGFELIDVFEEYYNLMAGIKKSKNKKNEFKKSIQDNAEYEDKDKTKLLVTEKMTNVMVSNKVQQFILNENLEEK